jgi:hypothetical protein
VVVLRRGRGGRSRTFSWVALSFRFSSPFERFLFVFFFTEKLKLKANFEAGFHLTSLKGEKKPYKAMGQNRAAVSPKRITDLCGAGKKRKENQNEKRLLPRVFFHVYLQLAPLRVAPIQKTRGPRFGVVTSGVVVNVSLPHARGTGADAPAVQTKARDTYIQKKLQRKRRLPRSKNSRHGRLSGRGGAPAGRADVRARGQEPLPGQQAGGVRGVPRSHARLQEREVNAFTYIFLALLLCGVFSYGCFSLAIPPALLTRPPLPTPQV